MSWISNIFKKQESTSTSGKKQNNVVSKPIIARPINRTNSFNLISYGGELPAAVVIGEIKRRYPEYYKNLYVILDNGHGEDTPGKRSPDGKFREYKYARVIVSMIADELEKLGIAYHILVPETNDISLSERVKRANKIHTEQHKNGKTVILLSIHCNAAGNGDWKTARGWSAWTSRGTTESDAVASCLYQAAHEILDPKKIQIRKDMSDGDEDWESNFYIIYKSSMPSVLTENFFQDNKEDVKYLESEEGKKDIVDIHIKGIQKYIELKFGNKK